MLRDDKRCKALHDMCQDNDDKQVSTQEFVQGKIKDFQFP